MQPAGQARHARPGSPGADRVAREGRGIQNCPIAARVGAAPTAPGPVRKGPRRRPRRAARLVENVRVVIASRPEQRPAGRAAANVFSHGGRSRSMGRPRGRGRRAPGTARTQRRLPAALLVVAIVAAAAAAGAAHPAWAQAHDETRHGRLAVEEPVYVMEAHMPVTVRITGQVFAESDERRQVVVAVTLPDSSRSEQYATATRSGHFAVPYQLDKPFPTGADSRPGRYTVSASHGGAHLGTVHFEVVRPPQVPAALQGGGEGVGGPAAEPVGVTGLSASVSRPVYSPDAAVTVHGAAEGAGAGVRLRIDVAGPSGGVVYSGALTTSTAGTYSATIMAPNGRWGGDGEYTAVVTGAGQLARAPFWVESGDMGGGGGGGAAVGAAAREGLPAEPAEPQRTDTPTGPAQGAAREEAAAPQGAAREEAADKNTRVDGGLDAVVVLAVVLVVGIAGIAAVIAVHKAKGSGRGERATESRMPVAHRPVAPEVSPAAPGSPALRTKQCIPAPRHSARGGLCIVLDMSIVIKHKEQMNGELENPSRYKQIIEYVDSHRADLLIPRRDKIRPDTIEHARASLKPFKNVSGYEQQELCIMDLKEALLNNPLSAESISWIVRKLTWLKGTGSVRDAKIGAMLGEMGVPLDLMPEKLIKEMKAVEVHGGSEEGMKNVKYLLDSLSSWASSDMQVLAIAMKESEERMVILFTDDYDFFAFPIWDGPIDKSECAQVTMVVGPADVRWIVRLRDKSAKVIDSRARAKHLYGDEEYMEVLRALQCTTAAS